MAKKAQPNKGADKQTDPAPGKETTAAYFRAIFEKRPQLLNERSNKAILRRWLKDHPGEKEVSKSVKANLANIKSVMRSKKRSKVAARAQKEQAPGEEKKVARMPTGNSQLELLEHQIDECMILAKTIDRDRLASIISHLRSARNEVVWKLGK